MENNSLAQKVESKAVTKTVPGGDTIYTLIQSMKGQLQAALPQHIKIEHFLRTALTAVRKTPKLALCTKESFLGSLLNAAQIGLEPSLLGQCYLIPYGTECQLIIGYQGLLTLVYRSNKVKEVYAEIIYEKDEFKITYGLNRTLDHTPNFCKDRGKPLFTYAVATLSDGNKAWVVLPEHEIEKRKNKGQAGNIWREWPDEMRKKTALKYLCKLLPMSVNELEAINQDETIKKELSPNMMSVEDEFIEAKAEPMEPELAPAKNNISEEEATAQIEKKRLEKLRSAKAAHEETERLIAAEANKQKA